MHGESNTHLCIRRHGVGHDSSLEFKPALVGADKPQKYWLCGACKKADTAAILMSKLIRRSGSGVLHRDGTMAQVRNCSGHAAGRWRRQKTCAVAPCVTR